VANWESFATAKAADWWGAVGARTDKRSRNSLVWSERPSASPWCSRWMRWGWRMVGASRQREALTAEEEYNDQLELMVREAVEGVIEQRGAPAEVTAMEAGLKVARDTLSMMSSLLRLIGCRCTVAATVTLGVLREHT
jgi:hypothetical protein